jgi:hypothetical protein
VKFSTGVLVTLAVILILASLDVIDAEMAARLALVACAYTLITLMETWAFRAWRRQRGRR